MYICIYYIYIYVWTSSPMVQNHRSHWSHSNPPAPFFRRKYWKSHQTSLSTLWWWIWWNTQDRTGLTCTAGGVIGTGGKGYTWNGGILWDLGNANWCLWQRFEIWKIQIDVLGGSFAFSQRCNQKECVNEMKVWCIRHENEMLGTTLDQMLRVFVHIFPSAVFFFTNLDFDSQEERSAQSPRID